MQASKAHRVYVELELRPRIFRTESSLGKSWMHCSVQSVHGIRHSSKLRALRFFLLPCSLEITELHGCSGQGRTSPAGRPSAPRRRLVLQKRPALRIPGFHDWTLRLAVNEPSPGALCCRTSRHHTALHRTQISRQLTDCQRPTNRLSSNHQG